MIKSCRVKIVNRCIATICASCVLNWIDYFGANAQQMRVFGGLVKIKYRLDKLRPKRESISFMWLAVDNIIKLWYETVLLPHLVVVVEGLFRLINFTHERLDRYCKSLISTSIMQWWPSAYQKAREESFKWLKNWHCSSTSTHAHPNVPIVLLYMILNELIIIYKLNF